MKLSADAQRWEQAKGDHNRFQATARWWRLRSWTGAAQVESLFQTWQYLTERPTPKWWNA
jgi:hypothetical protein